MKFSLVMNCYVFIEIFEFFKRSVETLCNLHNSLDTFIYMPRSASAISHQAFLRGLDLILHLVSASNEKKVMVGSKIN